MQNLNLDNLKAGDEVVAVFVNSRGDIKKYGGVCIVIEFDEKLQRWCYAHKTSPTKTIGTFPRDGGCRYFMSKNERSDFYYSANPIHIKRAGRDTERAFRLAEEKRKEAERNLAEFKGKLESLLREYGAEITPVQTGGDDCGVSLEIECCIGNIGFQEESLK